MTDFTDRQRAEEAHFALDEETKFKIAARRNRLLGEWAAGVMNLTEEETDAYKKSVVQADFDRFAQRLNEHRLPGGGFYQVSGAPDADTANRLMEKVRAYRT